MEEQSDQEKVISELQRRRGRPKKVNIMSKNSNNMSSEHNNNKINGVSFDEDKKIRALEDIEDGALSAAQAEESTSRGGGREAVAAGEVTSKARTTNNVLRAIPTATRRRRKSNPTRSPLA